MLKLAVVLALVILGARAPDVEGASLLLMLFLTVVLYSLTLGDD